MLKNDKIYVAGHRGMVGSSILNLLEKDGCANIVTRTHKELDLTDQNSVQNFFKNERPDYVFLAAAKVGGILANNTFPAEFIYKNLMIECNVIEAAYQNNIKRLLFLGSSCIYPKFAKQPMSEDALLTGTLESTNEPYAIAKIAGIKLCESYNRQYGTDYRSVMPTNLYGPGDNFDLENSHVLPALIRRFHEAKESGTEKVTIWGTGKVRREFLHVNDMAAACIFVMNLTKEKYNDHTDSMLSHINVGTGEDVTIHDLAVIVKDVVGFKGKLVFDTSKPDGTPQKLLDVSKLNELGWKPTINLYNGIAETYKWFLIHENFLRK